MRFRWAQASIHVCAHLNLCVSDISCFFNVISVVDMVPWDAGAENAVSMKRLIAHLRKQRIGMVQTVQQYVFIYQAIYDEIREAFSDGGVAPQPNPVSSPGRVARSLSMASSTSLG